MRLFFTIYLKVKGKKFPRKKNFGTYDNTIGYNIKERRPYNTHNIIQMKDYNDDDYDNNDEDDLFGTHRLHQEIERSMFLQDASRGYSLVLDPKEFKELFGTITHEDKEDLTQSFFTQYHRLGVRVDNLVDVWGLDWIWVILKHIESTEEYELCSIIVDIMDEYSHPHIHSLLNGDSRKTLI
jgi:hypothetical protein